MALYLLLGAFTVWMAVDAYRRQAEMYWLFIILLFAPIGGFIYLFVVKLRQPPKPRESLLPAVTEKKPKGPSLMELEQKAAESPSVVNLLAYADAALEHKQFEKAERPYRSVIQRDQGNKEALHGLSLSLLEQDKATEAVQYLTELMDIDPRFRDFAAAIDYAEALWLDGDHALSLEVLEDIVRMSPRVPHRLLLANYLALDGDKERAKAHLRNALDDYAESPPFVRRRDMASARAAETLLGELGRT